MEFYDLVALKIVRGVRFQFPTGWNSTKLKITKLSLRSVSIPNGMEFYGSAVEK